MKKILKKIIPKPVWERLRLIRRSLLPFRIDGRGERVHIDKRLSTTFESMDMYQKNHIKRYEFAAQLVKKDDICGDFACGTGYGTVMLAEKVRQVVGADIDRKVINEIKLRYDTIKNINFVFKNILNLPFVNTFDVLVSFETIEHLQEKNIPQLFKVFAKALKPGGMFIFSTPYMQKRSKEAIEAAFHLTFNINEDKINEWLEQAGFHKVTYSYQNYESHIISGDISPKDFIIGVAQKNA